MEVMLDKTDPVDCPPIFIGGEGRSGTTLLSILLNSHSDIAHGPELHFRGPKNLGSYILDMLDKRTESSDSDWEKYRLDEEMYAGFHFVNRCHRCGVNAEQLRKIVTESIYSTNSNLEEFADRCYLINQIGIEMQLRKSCAQWGIKIMRDIRILNQYEECWPNATFIHLVRDGRDVAASQIKDHSSWGYDDIERAANSWVNIIKKVRSFSTEYNIIEVRYEDIVQDTQKTMQDLLFKLGLSWEDSVLEHTRFTHALYQNPYGHPSINTVVKPINSDSVGRWKQELSKEDVKKWESFAGPVCEELGYET